MQVFSLGEDMTKFNGVKPHNKCLHHLQTDKILHGRDSPKNPHLGVAIN